MNEDNSENNEKVYVNQKAITNFLNTNPSGDGPVVAAHIISQTKDETTFSGVADEKQKNKTKEPK